MEQAQQRRRDFYAGALMVLIGVGAVAQASQYDIGTLFHMGPGFFPIILGITLIVIGILIAGAAAAARREGEGERFLLQKPEWRGWFCILAGPGLFILLASHGGLVPAAFACVFVSALGDRMTTLRQALILASGVTFFGVLLFAYVLQVSLPLFQWGST